MRSFGLKFGKKIVSFVLVGVLLCTQFLTGFVYAEEGKPCNVCGGSTAELQEYQDFVYEVLSAIKTTIPKGSDMGKVGHPGLFEAGYYKIPEKNLNILRRIAKKIGDKITQTAGFAEMTAIMAGTFGAEFAQGGAEGFMLLFKQEPFVLAYAALIKVDTAVHDKMFDLGLAGAWHSKLTDVNRLQLESILKKYSAESDNIFAKYSLSTDVEYKDVMMLLWEINSIMKNFIVNGGKVNLAFENLPEDGVKFGGEKISVLFHSSVFSTMDSSYACARKYECSKAVKNFGESMKKIGNTSSDSFGRSWKLITDSMKDFKNAFGTIGASDTKNISGKELTDEQREFLEKQDEQFRSLYGVRSSEILKGSLKGRITSFRSRLVEEKMSAKDYLTKKIITDNIDAVNQKAKKITDKLSYDFSQQERANFEDTWGKAVLECLNNDKKKFDVIISRLKDASPDLMEMVSSCEEVNNINMTIKKNRPSYIKDNEGDENNKPTEKNFLNALNSFSSVEESIFMKEYFVNSVDQIFEQQLIDMQFAVVAGNRDVTMFFSNIFDELIITKELIGNKDTDGLISNLGKACELQCENKGGLCYR